tara:strand:+ start:317 stop:511 length:195 start_codon:yes stop_codon:yes gene_type:complete
MPFSDLDQKDKICADFKKAADLEYIPAVSWINDSKKIYAVLSNCLIKTDIHIQKENLYKFSEEK